MATYGRHLTVPWRLARPLCSFFWRARRDEPREKKIVNKYIKMPKPRNIIDIIIFSSIHSPPQYTARRAMDNLLVLTLSPRRCRGPLNRSQHNVNFRHQSFSVFYFFVFVLFFPCLLPHRIRAESTTTWITSNNNRAKWRSRPVAFRWARTRSAAAQTTTDEIVWRSETTTRILLDDVDHYRKIKG